LSGYLENDKEQRQGNPEGMEVRTLLWNATRINKDTKIIFQY